MLHVVSQASSSSGYETPPLLSGGSYLAVQESQALDHRDHVVHVLVSK